MRYTPKKMLQDPRPATLLMPSLGRSRPRLIVLLLVVISGLGCSTPLRAQQRVRTAAGRLEIESFSKPEVFFRLGPFQEELTGSVGFEFNDNSDLTPSGKISRFSFYEALDLNTTWVITHLNELKFHFGGKLSEDFFSNGRSELNVGITPDSLVQFQFAISDYQVRLYDHFSYIQDPTANPTATNTAYLNSLTNTVGAVVDADWNLAIFSLSADYTYNNQSGSNSSGQTNQSTSGSRDSFRIGSSVSFRWSPTVLYGIETGLSRSIGSGGGNSGTTNGKTNASASVNSLSVGPFIRGKLSRLTDLDISAGATLTETKPSIPPGYYFSGVVRHHVNRNWQLILSASHDLIFTTGTDLTEETVLRAASQFNLTRFITFTATPSVTFGDARSGSQGFVQNGSLQGNYKDYTFEASLAWKLRRHLVTTLTYEFKRRDAESGFARYTQNALAFEVSYVF
jgi:hypothetical protein